MTEEMLASKWLEICDACEAEAGDPWVAWICFLGNQGIDKATLEGQYSGEC